jgi:hypothetical protein
MKLLFYIGMPVMATRKHPLLLEADIIANGVIGECTLQQMSLT